jgi:ABC-type tungstate transport system substrate-binding protein
MIRAASPSDIPREVIMTTETHKGGFADNLAMQMIALAVAVAIVLWIAWRYVF